jgi:hypothetical protein
MKIPLGSQVGAILLMAGGVILLGLAAGCQRTLFADSDPSTTWKLDRYYGGDSAVETTEARKKSSDLGFGLPSGVGGGSGN